MAKELDAVKRELRTMDGDEKGKNLNAESLPTFARAPNNVQELVLGAELRLRYTYTNVQGQVPSSGEAPSSRERFRLRLNADYKLNDHFVAGVAVQTNQAADSGNVTFSEGFDNYSLYLWRFFVGWKVNDDLTIIAGKQANPFFSGSDLFFDPDISPTGVTEQFEFPITSSLEIAINAGQFIFYDNPENAFYNNPRTITDASGATVANPNYVAGGDNNQDAYLLYQQVVATYKPRKDLTFDLAGDFMFYAGHGGAGSTTVVNPPPAGSGAGGGTLLNAGAFNSANATRNLTLGQATADVRYDLGPKFKIRLYGDVDYNFQGGARDAQEYSLPAYHHTIDKLAFNVGLTIGSDYTLKKKGDYRLLLEYRQVGLGSLDPNLNDSDFNIGRLGFRGLKASASYAIRPWLITTLTAYFTDNIEAERNVNFGGLVNSNAIQVAEFDLTTKF